jgi:hypothetical protein
MVPKITTLAIRFIQERGWRGVSADMTKTSKFGGERPCDLLLSVIKRVGVDISSPKASRFILGMRGHLTT